MENPLSKHYTEDITYEMDCKIPPFVLILCPIMCLLGSVPLNTTILQVIKPRVKGPSSSTAPSLKVPLCSHYSVIPICFTQYETLSLSWTLTSYFCIQNASLSSDFSCTHSSICAFHMLTHSWMYCISIHEVMLCFRNLTCFGAGGGLVS